MSVEAAVTFSSPAHIPVTEERSFGAQMNFSGLPVSSLSCCSYNCISTPMKTLKWLRIFIGEMQMQASPMYAVEEKS